MGTTFFRSGFDPLGSLVGRFNGNNSWLSRMTSYDPLMSSSVGKAINPQLYAEGQAYANRRNAPAGYTPTYGGPASLAGANTGYVAASQKVMNDKNNAVMNGNGNMYGQ